MSERLVSPEAAAADVEPSLRPQRLAEFIGQAQLRANLGVFIQAARQRREALDHVLLAGPPGLGKTTLAQIIATELGVGFRMTSGPVILRAGDLAAQLTNLQPRDVLFIDEIHRLSPAVEEILYPAMEDVQLDLMIGEGPGGALDPHRSAAVHADRRDHPHGPAHHAVARPLRHPLAPPFLRPSASSSRSSCAAPAILELALTGEGAAEIARRARGTPAGRHAAVAPGARLRAGRRHGRGRCRASPIVR